MWKIGRIAGMVVLALALIDTIAIYNGEGFLFLFKGKQAAFLYLFSVAFFMAAGLMFMIHQVRYVRWFAVLGVLFAVRAGMTVPEGAEPPWCRETNPTHTLCR